MDDEWDIPLVFCYMAIEHDHRNSVFTNKDGDFP